MTIESPVALDHGSVMRFRMQVHGQQADIEARVVACSRAQRKGFDVGLEFISLPPPLQEALARATASGARS